MENEKMHKIFFGLGIWGLKFGIWDLGLGA
jgi:hypothetical protein